MAAGSIPASILTALTIQHFFEGTNHYKTVLTTTLGIMLLLTAAVLLFRQRIQNWAAPKNETSELTAIRRHSYPLTLVSGFFLGILVTFIICRCGCFRNRNSNGIVYTLANAAYYRYRYGPRCTLDICCRYEPLLFSRQR